MTPEHGYLHGPHWYRTSWFSLRRKKWYRWHLPNGSYLDVSEDSGHADFDLDVEDWESLNYLMSVEQAKNKKDSRISKVSVAFILAGGLIGLRLTHDWWGAFSGLVLGCFATWILLRVLVYIHGEK
jgi:hypothetical protein